MHSIRIESNFDSAHFLKNHTGKCRYVHGHRWVPYIKVTSTISTGFLFILLTIGTLYTLIIIVASLL